jgi:hypothetical protein
MIHIDEKVQAFLIALILALIFRRSGMPTMSVRVRAAFAFSGCSKRLFRSTRRPRIPSHIAWTIFGTGAGPKKPLFFQGLDRRFTGRPSKKPKVFYHAFRYQAKSWDRARRVVAKGEWHAVELFPRVGFVVTNLRRSPKRVIKFYDGRGTAEQWIKEGKNALKCTRLSCHRFKDNQVRLQLFALAYNLANFLRQLALPRPVRTWTLTTLRERLIKIGAKVVTRSKAVTFQMAEVAVPRTLFAAILDRIDRLRLVPATG